MTVVELASGAQMRSRGPMDGTVALMLGGGTGRVVSGTWSSSVELLADHLSETMPRLGIVEVKYRIRSWRHIQMCIADAHAARDAIAAAGATNIILIGYSMGGAVSTQTAGHPLIETVIGLAPWLPPELDMDQLAGRRFHVLHGTRDPFLGTAGVSTESSRRGFERIVAQGGTGSYTLIPGGFHAIALRAPWGAPVGMPTARTWRRELTRLVAAVPGV